jgi:uncharacterized OsmC-like protein
MINLRKCHIKQVIMHEPDKIRAAIQRVSSTLKQRPAFGLGTAVSKASITDGLTCEVQEGDWNFVLDMPKQAGGNGAGPTPGVLGRAALGSCLAIGYKMKACQLGVPMAAIAVEVQADYDDGALFGTTENVPPGYLEVRYTVSVDSDATEEEILRVLDESDLHSPYLDVFSRAQTCIRTVQIVSSKKQD